MSAFATSILRKDDVFKVAAFFHQESPGPIYILELPSLKCISDYFYKTTGAKLIIGEREQVNLVVLKA